MNLAFERMTKGRHLFECHSCGAQEVTHVDAASITHYCGGATVFKASESLAPNNPLDFLRRFGGVSRDAVPQVNLPRNRSPRAAHHEWAPAQEQPS